MNIQRITFALLFCLSIYSCGPNTINEDIQNDEKNSINGLDIVEETNAKGETGSLAETSNKLAKYISKTEADVLLQLKTLFEEGLRSGMENRSIGYAYEQHAIRMRLEIINNEPQSHLYPYNGAFTLEANSELVDQLSVFTKKCGFQVNEIDTIVHFYCLDANSLFMNYLKELGKTNELIYSFYTFYLEEKSLKNSFKNSFFVKAPEMLNLNRQEDQIFYFLMHILFNEEFQAYLKVNSPS